MKKQTLTACLLTGLIFLTARPGLAEKYSARQHEAHEHGSARLMIASEKNSLQMELLSPAINLLGFEHRPRNKKQRDAVDEAIKTLKSADEIFSIPLAAQCTLVHADIKTSLTEDEHDEHEKHLHHEHNKHEGKAAEQHAGFSSEYDYQCANLPALKQIRLKLFERFPATHKLDVQMITDKGQKAFELDRDHPLISF
ncbi:MAG: DUF2796 domain-containing protein [Gammaproteobacteria bacterium]|nr:DUF2796 domain-containing protein [Gammaproteobacteria bacterium]